MAFPQSPPRRRAVFAGAALLAAAGLAFGIIAGFFGDRVYLFDTMAQFRAHAALALLMVALVLFLVRLQAAGAASVLAAGLGLVSVYPFLAPHPDRTAEAGVARYTLLQMNLRFDAPDKTRALSLIGTLKPDVVTVQELTHGWQRALETLLPSYPYQFYCTGEFHNGDVAIVSRRPFVEGDVGVCDEWSAFAAKRVDFNGSQVIVASEHLRWPFPGRQWRQIARLAPTLALLGDPLLIGGDFNSVPWSAAMGAYAATSGTRITMGIGPTWFFSLLPPIVARYVGLPIDNILASKSVEVLSVVRAPATASEHLPVFATFTLTGMTSPEPKVETVAR